MESSRRTNIALEGSPKLPLQLDPQIERLLQHEKIELREVQSLMIPLIATRRDILAISTLGPGVTTACVYGIMNALCLDATTEPGPKAIILLPTRELAIQVYDTFGRLRPAHKLQIKVEISHSDHPTTDETSERFDVVVDTPGKVLGAVQSGALSLGSVRYYMFDEVWSLLGNTCLGFHCRTLCQKIPSGTGARIVTSSSGILPAMGRFCLRDSDTRIDITAMERP